MKPLEILPFYTISPEMFRKFKISLDKKLKISQEMQLFL